MAESLYNLFEKAVSFSKQKRIKRLFRYPFFTISRSIVLRLRAFHVFKFLISAKTFWGEKMFFPVQCDRLTIFQWGFITGEPEIELTRTMIRHLKEGDVFVDIGAHHGFYSLLASCLVGDSGQVYSFEPTPRTFQVLAKNTFQKKNISIYQKAIWNRGGGGVIEFTDFGEKFSECNTWLKKTVIDKANNTSEKKNIKVSAITLDGFVERKNIPNFIKLDVEGAELFALEGMENILKNYSPLLSVEFWGGKNWMETNDKIFNFLKNFGYQPYSVKEGKLLKYDGKKQFNYANFIFKKE